jgi:hypothetical protein
MERLKWRLTEATAALATLDELVGKDKRTLVERDSAVLRRIYTYEAVWKVCQKLLSALENVSAASPNATIRAARSLGWLSDEDARAAIKLGEERNWRFTCIAMTWANRSMHIFPNMRRSCTAGSTPCR